MVILHINYLSWARSLWSVSLCCDHVENGQIAAVRAGDQIYLAHVWLDKSGVLQLLPSNVAYSSHFFAGEALNAVQIIGKAVEVRHIFEWAKKGTDNEEE